VNTFSDVLKQTIANDFGIVKDEIVEFAKLSFFKNKEHRYHKGYKSFPYQEVDKYFGRSQFDVINNNLKLFDVLSYSFTDKLTKAIKPSSKLTQSFNKAIDQWLPDIDEEEHNHISKSGGILSRNTNSNNKKFKGNILQAVKVNVKALYMITKITPKNKKETRIKIQSAVMLDLAINNKKLPKGWISQQYVEHKTGRLYSVGVSLQNCCREVRYGALNKLFSYDLDNCHYSILAQKARNTHTPNINYYLANKNKVRNKLARDLNLPIDQVKQILISLIFGASLTEFKIGYAIADIAKTKDVYEKITSNNLVQGLYREVSKAGKELIKNHTVKTGRYAGKVTNAMGLICGDRESSKKLSHILQGYEVKALEIVTSITQNDTAALLHDGWVTYSKYDKRVFEQALKSKLSINLTVEFEIIECKFNHDDKSLVSLDTVDDKQDKNKLPCKLIERAESFTLPFPYLYKSTLHNNYLILPLPVLIKSNKH
jgi:hypothetical protein